MWDCKNCFRVFHFRCIKTWYTRDARGFLGIYTWRCSDCLHTHTSAPKATCWCGKKPFDPEHHNEDIPNSCANTCQRTGLCDHDKQKQPCQKSCHPGPCDAHCPPACRDLSTEVSQDKGSSWKRLCQRWKRRTPGSLRAVLLLSLCVLVVEGAIIAFGVQHIKWWTQPYNYHPFTEDYADTEPVILSMFGIMVVGPLMVLLSCKWISTTGKFLQSLFNLEGPQKSCQRFFGGAFLIIIAAAFLALYPAV
jgi:hypothetical protein